MSDTTIYSHTDLDIAKALSPFLKLLGLFNRLFGGLWTLSIVVYLVLWIAAGFKTNTDLIEKVSGAVRSFGLAYLLTWAVIIALLVLGGVLTGRLQRGNISDALKKDWQLQATDEQLHALVREDRKATKNDAAPEFTELEGASVSYVRIKTPKGEDNKFRLVVRKQAGSVAFATAAAENRDKPDVHPAPSRPQPPHAQAAASKSRFRTDRINAEAGWYLIDGFKEREANGTVLTPAGVVELANMFSYRIKLQPNDRGEWRDQVNPDALESLLKDEREAMEAEGVPTDEIDAWEAQMVEALNNV